MVFKASMGVRVLTSISSSSFKISSVAHRIEKGNLLQIYLIIFFRLGLIFAAHSLNLPDGGRDVRIAQLIHQLLGPLNDGVRTPASFAT